MIGLLRSCLIASCALAVLAVGGEAGAVRGPHGVNKPVAMGRHLYFRGGNALWRSDGTSVGTERVAEIRPGIYRSRLQFLRAGETRVFFRATDGQQGVELGVTDGTEAGTRLLDLNPGPASSLPGRMIVVGDIAYFFAFSTISSPPCQLWRSDGTDAGTQPLTDTLVCGPTGSIHEAGGLLYFTASDASTGSEVWVSDGTPAGTRRLRDIHIGPGDGAAGTAFVALGDHVYFTADDGSSGPELWRSDGTEGGTELFFDFNGAPGEGGRPAVLKEVAGLLLISVYPPGSPGPPTLWRTDGSGAGTFEIAGIGPTKSVVEAGGKVFFVGGGTQLWQSDLTPGGATFLHDISSPACQPRHFFRELTPFGEQIILTGRQKGSDEEPWMSDGTTAGTHRLKDLNTRASLPRGYVEHEGRVYFSAESPLRSGTATDLWMTDGTEDGTKPLDCCAFDCLPVPQLDANHDGLLDGCTPPESAMRIERARVRHRLATARRDGRLRIRGGFATEPLGLDPSDGVVVTVRDGGGFRWETTFEPDHCTEVGHRVGCRNGDARLRFRRRADGETVFVLTGRPFDISTDLQGPVRVDFLHGPREHRVGTISGCTMRHNRLSCR